MKFNDKKQPKQVDLTLKYLVNAYNMLDKLAHEYDQLPRGSQGFYISVRTRKSLERVINSVETLKEREDLYI